MPVVLYETREPDGTEWRTITAIDPHDPPGSVVDITYGRCDVLLFSCLGPSSGVSRVTDNVYDLGAAKADVLKRGTTESLCRLFDRESFEMDIQITGGALYRARWTHYDRYIPGWTRHA